jgi:hypothetical protein
VAKAERKNRTKAEVDQIIDWLTGWNGAAFARQLEAGTDFRAWRSLWSRVDPDQPGLLVHPAAGR